MFIIMLISKEKIELISDFKTNLIQNDISEYLLNEENKYNDIIPGVEKKIIWYNKKKN